MVGELRTNVSEMDIFKLAEPLGPQVKIAIALAGVLYWRAWVHERRASESELRFISNLLINRSFTNLGKLVAHSVPKIFDRVFHPNVIWQFIWRSVVASTISWAILLTIGNPHPFAWQLGTFSSHRLYNTFFVILMYCVDIVSLWKTHLLKMDNYSLYAGSDYQVCFHGFDDFISIAVCFIPDAFLYTDVAYLWSRVKR